MLLVVFTDVFLFRLPESCFQKLKLVSFRLFKIRYSHSVLLMHAFIRLDSEKQENKDGVRGMDFSFIQK